MGEKTGIEWTNHTYNPWQGCHKVSSGCVNCYMYREKIRYGQDPAVVVRSRPGTFNKPLTWKEPGLIFTCSWSDFFIEEADPWRDEAWDIIRRTPHLTYQVLTKRPENIMTRLPFDWGEGWPNVWLGITAEDQKNADVRIPILLTIPAVLRFVSVEPMLGPVDLWNMAPFTITWWVNEPKTRNVKYWVDWVIVGSESSAGGQPGRPCDLTWVRDLRDRCIATDTPLFIKQLEIGGNLVKMPELDGQLWAQFP